MQSLRSSSETRSVTLARQTLLQVNTLAFPKLPCPIMNLPVLPKHQQTPMNHVTLGQLLLNMSIAHLDDLCRVPVPVEPISTNTQYRKAHTFDDSSTNLTQRSAVTLSRWTMSCVRWDCFLRSRAMHCGMVCHVSQQIAHDDKHMRAGQRQGSCTANDQKN